jgi:predicted Mrr-cat superfamily restriction endonuclease
MINIWCIRANGGQYTEHFLKGGYAGIGWREIAQDLGDMRSRDDLYPIVQTAYPDQKSPIVIGNYVGQMARFLFEIQAGDYVVTPAADTEWLHYGKVEKDPSYFYAIDDDGCPYRHRRRVVWVKERLKRSDFSVPFQNTIRSSLTVFAISQRDEFLAAIGSNDATPKPPALQYDPYRFVLERVLELNPKEFEFLVRELLDALGFEGSEVTGKTGDGGVDATGVLDVAGLAKIKIFVQAKRYKLGTKISANTVKQLRQTIPHDGQGAFITTADFQKGASDVALDPNFYRIGLINGRQLVDLLVEHWAHISKDFQERLGLKPGLVRV